MPETRLGDYLPGIQVKYSEILILFHSFCGCLLSFISTTFDRAIRKKKMTSEKKVHMVAVTYKYGFNLGNEKKSVFCKVLLLKA